MQNSCIFKQKYHKPAQNIKGMKENEDGIRREREKEKGGDTVINKKVTSAESAGKKLHRKCHYHIH